MRETQFCLSSLPQFIIEDMKQQQTNKHSNLHREDQHITVEELWKGWKTSEGKHKTNCLCPEGHWHKHIYCPMLRRSNRVEKEEEGEGEGDGLTNKPKIP